MQERSPSHDHHHDPSHGYSKSNPWIVLIAVALGMFMVVVDITILNVALPTIARKMSASITSVQWTLIAYTLVLTGLVPLWGRISDVLGRKRLFIAGIIIFGSASLLAAFSTSILWLIGARIIQAIGGSLITTNALAIITDAFPEGKRGTAMGMQAIMISGGAAVGPTLGGYLVTHFGWQAVFLVNVPVAFIASIFAAFVLPIIRSHRRLEPIDWRGAALLLTGLPAMLLGLTKGPSWGWATPQVIAPITVGVAILVLFVRVELRREYPLIDLSLFRIRPFAAGQVAGVFATLSLASMMLLIPFYFQALRGYTPEKAGILMLPMPATIMVVAPLAGRLSDKIGARGVATTGLLLLMTGLFLFTRLTAGMALWDVLWRFVVFGSGLAMFMAPNNNAVMSSVPPKRRGTASGLLGTFRFTGQSVGVALAGTVFAAFAGASLHGLFAAGSASQLASSPAKLHAFQHAFVRGLHAAAYAGMPFAAIGALLSVLRGKLPRAKNASQQGSDSEVGRETA